MAHSWLGANWDCPSYLLHMWWLSGQKSGQQLQKPIIPAVIASKGDEFGGMTCKSIVDGGSR